MQLSHERPDYAWVLRGADGRQARVNDRVLVRSLALAPDRLVEDWPAAATAAALEPAHLQPLLELQPELIVLGTGARQAFPPPAVMAACLTRGIGIEVMDNAAAARTYNVLAGEGRRVVVALLLDGGAGD
ncbi:Mth938-like domain-containing protein [Pseudoxanthomonas sp.]|uniref:Mth938-like domain-containing protein n=1 Tax=Pseudoxanthomonas sp. TaxID=1871049 RepID=UPI0025899B68|nr:Mth938-like domain-containing protein [Pseudoxanthomonas sp.]MCR6686359.1 Mth938-like domain-containing protein [Pseudoxanthomonas sp.]